MKITDTDSLRAELEQFSPEQQREKTQQETQNTIEAIDNQLVSLRKLLSEVEKMRKEFLDIHSSLRNTLNRENMAKKALQAAADSADNVVSGICKAIAKAEQNTVIPAKVEESELAKLNKYVDSQISKDKELLTHHKKVLEQMMENHRTELSKHLRNNEGVWLSDRWMKIIFGVYTSCMLAVALWASFR